MMIRHGEIVNEINIHWLWTAFNSVDHSSHFRLCVVCLDNMDNALIRGRIFNNTVLCTLPFRLVNRLHIRRSACSKLFLWRLEAARL